MSAWLLYFKPDSEQLFWSQSSEQQGVCELIGEAPKKSKEIAESIWNLLPNRKSFPKFADLYKEKDDAPAVVAEVPRSANLFEAGERWKGAPKVCEYENLLAFDSTKSMAGFLKFSAPSVSVIHRWKCPVCAMWHMQTGAPAPSGTTSGTQRNFYLRPPRAVREKLMPAFKE